MLNTHRTELRSNNCPIEELWLIQSIFKNQGQVFSIEENVHRKHSEFILNFFNTILKFFSQQYVSFTILHNSQWKWENMSIWQSTLLHCTLLTLSMRPKHYVNSRSWGNSVPKAIKELSTNLEII